MIEQENNGIIYSDNEQGNDAHYAKDGKFAPKDGSGEPSQENLFTKEDTIGLLKGDTNVSYEDLGISEIEFLELQNTYGNISKSNVDELDEFIQWVTNVLNGVETEDSEEEYDDDILNMPELQILDETQKNVLAEVDIDANKIRGINQEDLLNLVNALQTISNKDFEMNSKLQKFNVGMLDGLWMNPVKPSDYEALEKGGNFEKKLNYFKQIYTGPDSTEKINKLIEFQEAGEKYIAKKNALLQEYKTAQNLIDKYISNNPYSEKRKQKAFNPSVYDEMSEMMSQSFKELTSIPDEQYTAIKKYTSTYHYITEPLRKTKYYGDVSAGVFLKDVENITKGLTHTFDYDIIVNRRVSDLDVLNSIIKGKKINQFSMQELNDLVGTSFIDQSFASASVGNVGSLGGPIRLQIYCPAGIEMQYINPISHYMGSAENEMLINRGYSYKITSIEKSGYYGMVIKCDCILGSNLINRYSDDELKEIANTYL